MLTYILFIVGFVVLIKGANYLVEGASAIAQRFGLAPIFIGLTIVAFGTSAPELFVNVIASINGSSGIAVGNILGSNISNILLILGVAAVIYPLSVKTNTIRKEIPLSLLAILVLAFLVNDKIIDGSGINILSRIDGFILVAFFVMFMLYAFNIRKNSEAQQLAIVKHNNTTAWLMIVVGMIGLVIGGKWIIDGGIVIAQVFGLSETLVGLTIIAIGTSLPELATSAVAAYKKKTDIAIGNVIGSNLFNIFWVLGLSSIIRPLEFPVELNFDILVVVGATVLLLIALFVGKKKVLQKWEGYVFVLLYIAYITFLIYRG